jgi:hyperosmotically inducible periplasmic protein
MTQPWRDRDDRDVCSFTLSHSATSFAAAIFVAAEMRFTMKTIARYIVCIAAGSVVSLGGCDSRESTPAARTTSSTPERSTTTTPADNTGRNWDDAGRDAKTPIDQSQSTEHIKLTADIRKAVMANDMLSMGAKNCKIITDTSGQVWLRGVVDSQAEKDQIQRLARQIAGTNNVTNELEVKVAS